MLTVSLGYLPADDAGGIVRFLSVFFLFSSLSGAFLGIGWTAWVRNWVPRQVQGRYFGNRNRWISFFTLGFLVLAMVLFELDETALWPFQALFSVAVVLRFLSLIWQNTIHVEGDRSRPSNTPWKEQFAACRRARGLLPFVLFSTWISFWIAFVTPFVPVFSFEELGVPPGRFSVLVLLATAAAMVGWSFWGRLADRFGSIPLLATGLLLWELSNLVWVFVTPGTVWLLYPLWIWGGFISVSYWLCNFNLLLNLLPVNARVLGSSMNLALTSLAAAIAPILSGWLLQHFLAGNPENMWVYRVGFAVKSAAILLSVFAIRALHEPHRSNRNSAPGAFSTVRMLLSNAGPTFLATLIPQRSRSSSRK